MGALAAGHGATPGGGVAPDRIDHRVDLAPQRGARRGSLGAVVLQQPVDLDDVGGHAADVAAGAFEGGAGRGEQQRQHQRRHGGDQGDGELDHVLGVAGEVVLRQPGPHDGGGDGTGQDEAEGGGGKSDGTQGDGLAVWAPVIGHRDLWTKALHPNVHKWRVSTNRRQLNRTYSKSAAWLLMPRAGGAIQWAYLPGCTTAGPISEVT